MSAAELRLPKLDAAQAREPELLALLRANPQPLWKEAAVHVPLFVLTPPVEAALRSAGASGHVVRGLEGAERVLCAEQRGLSMADEKSQTARGIRVSRLLILAGDGAQRFYRNVEVLLHRHGPRVLALRFDVDANRLGETLFGPGEIARLVLLTRKEAVVAALLSLLEAPPPG